ncbi:MAG: hypothetical protein Q4D58_09680 [Synergistaceae bacterium]|nr:hypothetical protein [Synergistaceae bacterium]
MRLNTKRTKGGGYVYFLESYRESVTKKSRTRSVKRFGRLWDLLAYDQDIMSKMQAECDMINAMESTPCAAELDALLKKAPIAA